MKLRQRTEIETKLKSVRKDDRNKILKKKQTINQFIFKKQFENYDNDMPENCPSDVS